ncbi:MAG: hypothetical protein IJ228_05170 [Succinivibrio sp.]|nr:hypothetical protein [Succinivibrio sp.]
MPTPLSAAVVPPYESFVGFLLRSRLNVLWEKSPYAQLLLTPKIFFLLLAERELRSTLNTYDLQQVKALSAHKNELMERVILHAQDPGGACDGLSPFEAQAVQRLSALPQVPLALEPDTPLECSAQLNLLSAAHALLTGADEEAYEPLARGESTYYHRLLQVAAAQEVTARDRLIASEEVIVSMLIKATLASSTLVALEEARCFRGLDLLLLQALRLHRARRCAVQEVLCVQLLLREHLCNLRQFEEEAAQTQARLNELQDRVSTPRSDKEGLLEILCGRRKDLMTMRPVLMRAALALLNTYVGFEEVLKRHDARELELYCAFLEPAQAQELRFLAQLLHQ